MTAIPPNTPEPAPPQASTPESVVPDPVAPEPPALDAATASQLADLVAIRGRAMRLVHASANRAEAAEAHAADAPLDPAAHTRANAAGLAFTRHANLVRAGILAENRLRSGRHLDARAGKKAPADKPCPPRRQPDTPHQKILRTTLHDLVKNEPTREARQWLNREIDKLVDAAIDATPQQTITDIFLAIAEELQIRFDPAQLHDVIIGLDTDASRAEPYSPFAKRPGAGTG